MSKPSQTESLKELEKELSILASNFKALIASLVEVGVLTYSEDQEDKTLN